jgi:uncharacterized protein
MKPARFAIAMGLALSLLVAVHEPAAAAQLTEERLLRPVPGGTLRQETVSAVAAAYRVSDETFTTPDGTHLHAVLLRQPRARGVVLYFGGNGFTIERFGAQAAAFFARLGVDLMIVDHRGYGMSQGRPTVASLESDGLAAFDHLAGLRGIDRRRIVVHGQSLGSFTAGHVAAHRPTAGVVLESSVTSTEQWVGLQMGTAAAIAAPLQGKGNLRYMPAIEEPLLILVGAEDRVTPPALSQALFDASPLSNGRKTLSIVPAAGHNDALASPAAVAAYESFLARALGTR